MAQIAETRAFETRQQPAPAIGVDRARGAHGGDAGSDALVISLGQRMGQVGRRDHIRVEILDNQPAAGFQQSDHPRDSQILVIIEMLKQQACMDEVEGARSAQGVRGIGEDIMFDDFAVRQVEMGQGFDIDIGGDHFAGRADPFRQEPRDRSAPGTHFKAAPAGLYDIEPPLGEGIKDLLQQFKPPDLVRLASPRRENIVMACRRLGHFPPLIQYRYGQYGRRHGRMGRAHPTFRVRRWLRPGRPWPGTVRPARRC